MRHTPGPRWTLALLAGLAAVIVVYLVLDRQRTPPDLRRRADLADPGLTLRSVTLYVVEPDSLLLVPLDREVMAGEGTGAMVRVLVEQLAEPRERLVAPLPEKARVLHCFQVGESELVLDFNAALTAAAEGNIVMEELRLAALCRTLADNLPGVTRVRLLVHGQPLTRWGDHLAIPGVLEVQGT
jgi:hypothetical protein